MSRQVPKFAQGVPVAIALYVLVDYFSALALGWARNNGLDMTMASFVRGTVRRMKFLLAHCLVTFSAPVPFSVLYFLQCLCLSVPCLFSFVLISVVLLSSLPLSGLLVSLPLFPLPLSFTFFPSPLPSPLQSPSLPTVHSRLCNTPGQVKYGISIVALISILGTLGVQTNGPSQTHPSRTHFDPALATTRS